MPSEVAKHLPEPSELSAKVKDSAYIVQIFDQETGQPKRDGVVGMVTFTRNEKPVPRLSYAAHANYHITTADGGNTYGFNATLPTPSTARTKCASFENNWDEQR